MKLCDRAVVIASTSGMRLFAVFLITAGSSPSTPPPAAPAPSAPAATAAVAAPAPSAPCTDAATCARDCRAGTDAACVRYADLTPETADLGEVVPVFAEGCHRSAPTACLFGGLLALRSDAPDAAEAAAEFLERGCTLGAVKACGVLGNLAVDGRGVAKDPARALELWRRACDGGDGASCQSLGRRLEDDGEMAKALALYELGCERGEPRSCRTIGSRYADGDGVAADRDRALADLARACKGGDRLACGYEEDVRARVYPLERVTVRSFTIGHTGLKLSKATRTKAAARKLADAAVRELGRGARFEAVAKKYMDADPYSRTVGRENKFFRSDPARADAKQREFVERIFALKPKTAYASENPSFGFVVFYRPN